jgi:ribosomal protein S12 methylthiotransferase
MRGKFRSRPANVIEEEARALVELGVSELSLVSQDSVMWGRDAQDEFIHLLHRLEKIDGLQRMRLMYLHPQGVSDELIDAMLASEVVVPYFDLSLQHVSPRILKGMGRWGGRARFERMIGRIRAENPLAAVRTTFILGFPGEDERDAAEVESFVEDTDIDWVGVFTYSPEAGTRSYDLSDRVPESVARERAERVSRAAELTMDRRASSLIGHDLDVLVERYDIEADHWTGRSHREAPEIDGEVEFDATRPLNVGDYVSVRITGHSGADLNGVLAS